MAGSVALKLTSAVVAMVVLLAPATEAAVTCGQVVSSLAPCLNYLINGGNVPPACCSGVQSLFGTAANTADRRAACKCIKQAAAGVSGIKQANAAALPAKCSISLSFPIRADVDCDKVRY
ncbi:hypothetical protein Syun_000082 [Stephania yunnanensis]|uniref:Non-specific lipid-transfer protein n=1 Tax=Stephania yunnanensis TaxID=152371 RepID=A0AAP0LCW9_9MAGN